MARYTQDIILNKPDDFVAFMMNDYMTKNSFTQNTWKGAPVFRRGDGFFEGFRYLIWNYSNGVLHLEAWLKGPFGGEQGLTGFWGWAIKAAYRSDLEKLIALLQQTLPDPSMTGGMMPDGTPAPAAPIPVQTMDNHRNATFSLILGIVCILLCWSPLLCVVAGSFSIICYRSSKASSKAGQAKIGRVCAIVGMSITLALWVLNFVLIALGIVLS